MQETLETCSNPVFMDYGWIDFPNQARSSIASLLGCLDDQISLNSSSGEVISFLAQGLKWKKGDRVAVFDEEYASDVLPWLFAAENNSKITLDFHDRKLLRQPEKFLKALHPKTRILNPSHVGFQDGLRSDILTIGRGLRKKGIRFAVDVTQSLGGLQLRLEELALIDVMTYSTYKWMLAPYGQAFGYWSERILSETSQTHGN